MEVAYPVDKPRVTLKFAVTHRPYRIGNPHRGLDFSPLPGNADTGLPIYLTAEGRVALVEEKHQTRGNYVVAYHALPYDWWARDLGGKVRTIKAGTIFYSAYMHLEKIYVKKDFLYKPKYILGTLGNTGLSDYAHLHFEIGIGDFAKRDVVDPEHFLTASIAAYKKDVTYA